MWNFKTKTEMVFSCKTYSNNLCFIYNFEKVIFTVYKRVRKAQSFNGF